MYILWIETHINDGRNVTSYNLRSAINYLFSESVRIKQTWILEFFIMANYCLKNMDVVAITDYYCRTNNAKSISESIYICETLDCE